MSKRKVFKNIESIGKKNYKKVLTNWKREELKNNWWEALKFFFDHSFMRGRRDKLSWEYRCFAVEVLEDYFSIDPQNLDESYKKLVEKRDLWNKKIIEKLKQKKKWNSINSLIKILKTYRMVDVEWDEKEYDKNIHLGNYKDIIMVLGVLSFISDENQRNIYNWIEDTVKDKGIQVAYKELTKMPFIGDKIASFVLRDVLLLNPKLTNGFTNLDFESIFPIDRWVKNKLLLKELGCESSKDSEIKKYFIEKCENNISPLWLNAGMWYLGSHSLKILLENLERIEVNDG